MGEIVKRIVINYDEYKDSISALELVYAIASTQSRQVQYATPRDSAFIALFHNLLTELGNDKKPLIQSLAQSLLYN